MASRGGRTRLRSGSIRKAPPRSVCRASGGRPARGGADQHGRRADRRRSPRLGGRSRRRCLGGGDHAGLREDLPRAAGLAEVSSARCVVGPAAAWPGCRRRRSCSTVPGFPGGSRSSLPRAPRRWSSRRPCSGGAAMGEQRARPSSPTAGASRRDGRLVHAEDFAIGPAVRRRWTAFGASLPAPVPSPCLLLVADAGAAVPGGRARHRSAMPAALSAWTVGRIWQASCEAGCQRTATACASG